MLLLVLFANVGLATGQIAFPGAVGQGAAATGGRTGTIYHVTNLNDSGAGSFRDAVSASNRIIVFDVGGYIVLSSPVSASNNLTIFGQTAPGGGISTRAAETSLSSVHNIIVRGMRFRQGGEDSHTGESSVGISNGYNIDAVFDSSMTSQGIGQNITVQNSIFALPIYQGFGAHIEGGPMTFYRNLWVDEHNRQPLAKNNDIYINNVIYNYDLGYTAGNTGGVFSHDIVNNYFISGPSSSVPTDAFFQLLADQTAYAVGNLLDSNLNGVLDGTSYNTVDAASYSTTPWSTLTNSIPTLSATDAFYSVTATAGAWPRDTVDQFVVNDVLSLGTLGTQYKGESASAVANYPNSQANTGISSNGYGTIASGTPFTSTSNSGIPDYWANANGISTSNAGAGLWSFGTSGYLNIEAYANSLILPAPWTAADLNSPSTQGASSYNTLTSTWVLTGSGNSYSNADQGQFSSQPWTTNGSLTAEVTALDSGNAGIQFRSTTAATAAFAALNYAKGGMVTFEWRATDSASTQTLQVQTTALPVYLKLNRQSNVITGYYSTDGVSWLSVGSASVTLSQSATAGLYVSSGSSSLSVAQFQNVTLNTSTVNTSTTTATPTFGVAAGTYSGAQSVTISDTTPNSTIYYTTNGTTPTTSSSVYSGAITVSATETLEAIATSTGYPASSVATAAYVINIPANPVPEISDASPKYIAAGSAAFTLTINGSGFVSTSTAYWGSTALATTYVNARQLTALVTAAEIATAGATSITVQSPTPGGGNSDPWQFEVDSAGFTTAAPTFTSATASITAGSTASYPVIVLPSAKVISITGLNLPDGASCSYSRSTGIVTISTSSTTPTGTYLITIAFTETLASTSTAGIFLPILRSRPGKAILFSDSVA